MSRILHRLSHPLLRRFAAPSPFATRHLASMAARTLPRMPIFEALLQHPPAATAVVHAPSGRRFQYAELAPDVCRARDRLRAAAGRQDLSGERVAFLVENSYDYVVTLLAVFAARAIAVPLSPAFPAAELQYILNQSQARLLVASAKFAAQAQQVLATELESRPAFLQLEKLVGMLQATNGQPTPEPACSLEDDSSCEDLGSGTTGMMLYTSGTTNRPKGVLLPQSALTAQCRSLQEAWRYSASDHLLHVLPLHHIHGTVNAVLTPLFAGSAIEFLYPFNATAVWQRFAAPFLATPTHPPITFFTVVPTVYNRLLDTHAALDPAVAAAAQQAISPAHMRLAISGSAALPTPTKQKWAALSRGAVLLERYGMTEVGMALSCGLDPAARVDGSVGWPLPGVQARLVDVDTGQVVPEGSDIDEHGRERAGEIQLRGPTVFREYWRNPAATAAEFVTDDNAPGAATDDRAALWFKTGDVAVRRAAPAALEGRGDAWAQGPMYFVQGRLSADIIKTGGEKVSALEVERELLSLAEVAEAAVVAVPSGKWGQKVGAVVVLRKEYLQQQQQQDQSSDGRPRRGSRSATWSPMDMRRALRGRLVNYKIPQVLKVVEQIPRNAMGKVNKKQLVAQVFADEMSDEEQ